MFMSRKKNKYEKAFCQKVGSFHFFFFKKPAIQEKKKII